MGCHPEPLEGKSQRQTLCCRQKLSESTFFFLVATHKIAETTELLWNYQEHTSEFSNSQTLL